MREFFTLSHLLTVTTSDKFLHFVWWEFARRKTSSLCLDMVKNCKSLTFCRFFYFCFCCCLGEFQRGESRKNLLLSNNVFCFCTFFSFSHIHTRSLLLRTCRRDLKNFLNYEEVWLPLAFQFLLDISRQRILQDVCRLLWLSSIILPLGFFIQIANSKPA